MENNAVHCNINAILLKYDSSIFLISLLVTWYQKCKQQDFLSGKTWKNARALYTTFCTRSLNLNRYF